MLEHLVRLRQGRRAPEVQQLLHEQELVTLLTQQRMQLLKQHFRSELRAAATAENRERVAMLARAKDLLSSFKASESPR